MKSYLFITLLVVVSCYLNIADSGKVPTQFGLLNTANSPCIQKGLQCMTAPNACCEGLTCVSASGDWVCRGSCSSGWDTCQSDNDCCEGLVCERSTWSHKYYCYST